MKKDVVISMKDQMEATPIAHLVQLANQFGINSIPAVYLFKDGQVANKSVGLMPKAKVLEFIGV